MRGEIVVRRANGDRCWYRDGERHRTDGPAVELANGTRWWHRDGKFHRTNGPAPRLSGPAVEYWVDDRFIGTSPADLLDYKLKKGLT